MVKRSGSFWKKDLEALLTPKRFSLKGTVFKYKVMISCFVKLRSNLMAMILSLIFCMTLKSLFLVPQLSVNKFFAVCMVMVDAPP